MKIFWMDEYFDYVIVKQLHLRAGLIDELSSDDISQLVELLRTLVGL